MIVSLAPSTSQIRYYAQSALNGFGTLDSNEAADNAKSDLLALLNYLDCLERTDDPVAIFRSGRVETGIRSEAVVSQFERNDASDLKDVRTGLG